LMWSRLRMCSTERPWRRSEVCWGR
jgi:hypothetical protein